MSTIRVTMKLENMSPTAIAEELGHRLKQARLNANLTQTEVASQTGLSRKTILNAEQGKVQLEKFIAILIALNLTSQLNIFLPIQEISPLQLAKLKGRKRQRASKPRAPKNVDKKDTPSW